MDLEKVLQPHFPKQNSLVRSRAHYASIWLSPPEDPEKIATGNDITVLVPIVDSRLLLQSNKIIQPGCTSAIQHRRHFQLTVKVPIVLVRTSADDVF